ncbi:COG4705 family protein [Parafrigoribacterium soli]|uniref:COG4705 family protein n=1 Tax=Parafrigoribacterium soli TaxID=3144663 RepID=UPI0032EFDA0D
MTDSTTLRAAVRVLSKVPEVGVLFWVVKVLSTGMGETASDYLVKAFDPVIVVLLAAVAFFACFVVQFRAPRYVPWRYWLLVTMVSVFGTMIADVAHIVVGIPYGASSLIFAVALTVVFIVWWRTERTLSIHSITTPRRELFYWATIIVTFALGTAVGDFLARTVGLGYLGSGLLCAVLIAVPAVVYRIRRTGAVLWFWVAYVLTRPLGASFADWSAVSRARGGLDLGTGPVTIVALIAIIGLVAVLSVKHNAQKAL